MSRVVWKFHLPLRDDLQALTVPKDAQIVHVAMDAGIPTLWMEIPDHEAPPVARRFRVYGTGWEIKDPRLSHVGTVINGPFVWHIYEETFR